MDHQDKFERAKVLSERIYNHFHDHHADEEVIEMTLSMLVRKHYDSSSKQERFACAIMIAFDMPDSSTIH